MATYNEIHVNGSTFAELRNQVWVATSLSADGNPITSTHGED